MTDQAQDTVTLTCQICEQTGDVPSHAAAWLCPGCERLWWFRPCRTCHRIAWVEDENIKAWKCPHCQKPNRSDSQGQAALLGEQGRKRLMIAAAVVAVLVGVWLVKTWNAGAPYHDSSANRLAFFDETGRDAVLAQADSSMLLDVSKTVCTVKASKGEVAARASVEERSSAVLPLPSLEVLVDASIANFCP